MVASVKDRHENFGQLLHLVAKSWRQELDRRLKPLGFTRTKWLALIFIARSAGLSQRALAEKMEIGEPAVVALLDRLAKDEFILRKPVPGDRRARSIDLTAAGRGLISRIEAVAQALRDELLSGFSCVDLDTTSKVLTQMKLRIDAR